MPKYKISLDMMMHVFDDLYDLFTVPGLNQWKDYLEGRCAHAEKDEGKQPLLTPLESVKTTFNAQYDLNTVFGLQKYTDYLAIRIAGKEMTHEDWMAALTSVTENIAESMPELNEIFNGPIPPDTIQQ